MVHKRGTHGQPRRLLEKRTCKVQDGVLLARLRSPVRATSLVNELSQFVQGVFGDALLSNHSSHRHACLGVNGCQYGHFVLWALCRMTTALPQPSHRPSAKHCGYVSYHPLKLPATLVGDDNDVSCD